MTVATMINPDAGARIISSSVASSETSPAGAHPTFLTIEPGRNQAVIGFGDRSIRTVSLTVKDAVMLETLSLPNNPLSAHADVGGNGVLIGTDAGTVIRLSDGVADTLYQIGSTWVSVIAVHDAAGLRAFGAGRSLVVLDGSGTEILRRDNHPSTLMGLSFSPNGRWVAVAHYDGVSVWNLADPDHEKVSLDWHGSHTAIGWSPCGKFIVTAMQDREMHCWKWNDRTGMRMSGYPSKIRSLSWTADGRYVAASGADTVTSWDCSGKGPSGKPPLEFGYVYNGTVMQVAAHPTDRTVAGGYSDGSVMIGNIEQETAMIARAGNGVPVSFLAWTPDGKTLVAVDDAGAAAVMRFLDPLTA